MVIGSLPRVQHIGLIKIGSPRVWLRVRVMIWVLRLVSPRVGFSKWILVLGSPRVCLVISLGHLSNQVSILVLGMVLYLGKLFIHLVELFIHLGELFIDGSYQGFKAGLHGWIGLGCRLLVFGS